MKKIIRKNFIDKISNISGIDRNGAKIISENAYKIWQRTEKNEKTYEYVERFATIVRNSKSENFKVNIQSRKLTDNTELMIIEPPCGSNTYILCGEKKNLFIDCGFACYKNEMDLLFEKIIKNYRQKENVLVLTHCDIDHAGLCDIFDSVYMSEISKENFVREAMGKHGYREENPVHTPYRKIAEIITEYSPPAIDKIKTFKSIVPYTAQISDKFMFEDISISVISGNGGHVQGEIMLLIEDEKIIFTGDVFVNTKSYTKEQKEFSSIALYLVPSVNQNSEKAQRCRKYVEEKYKGYLACPGHGMWCIL